MDTTLIAGHDTVDVGNGKESSAHDLPGWAIHEKEDEDLLKQTRR